MHPQNAMLETSPVLCSARPRTGEPNATFGCTEASTAAWPCLHVHSINASVGPSPDEATSVTWCYQSNQQFSITAVTTSSGSVAERYAYTAYGQPTILDGSGSVLSSSAINNRYTYTGREWDQTLGLYHFRARWMSGLAGRFMRRDPIGFEGSEWGLYEYVGGCPLVYFDPSGLIKEHRTVCVFRLLSYSFDGDYDDCLLVFTVRRICRSVNRERNEGKPPNRNDGWFYYPPTDYTSDTEYTGSINSEYCGSCRENLPPPYNPNMYQPPTDSGWLLIPPPPPPPIIEIA
jgi:RHS repeat-associated protein